MFVTVKSRFLLLIIRFLYSCIWFLESLTNLSWKGILSFSQIFLVTIFFFSSFFLISRGNFSQNFFYAWEGYKSITQDNLVGLYQTSYFWQKYQQKEPKTIRVVSAPLLSAKSIYAFDRRNNKKLFSLNSTQHLAPASTAKLMTALVSLDLYTPGEILKIPHICGEVDSTKADLPAKAEFTAEELIRAMLVGSAGDAACALAVSQRSYDDFINLMNAKAALFNMKDTHFTNPIGLDDDFGENYSTAEDLYKLAVHAVNHPLIKDIVATKEYHLVSEDGIYDKYLFNTNRLLWEIPETQGVKTGTTTGAGEVLIYEYADTRKDIFIIILGSTDRFKDTKELLSWIFNSFIWRK